MLSNEYTLMRVKIQHYYAVKEGVIEGVKINTFLKDAMYA